MIDGGLRKIFRTKIPGFHWQSIESGITGGGIPDSNYCAPGGHEGWVEFKTCSSHKVGMRPEQIGWIIRRTRMGGRVFIAVRVRHEGGVRRGPPLDVLNIYRGERVTVLADVGCMRCPVDYSEYMDRVDWEEVADLLRGPFAV